jgi:hypothetical protein
MALAGMFWVWVVLTFVGWIALNSVEALRWHSASVDKEDVSDTALTSREKRLHALLDLLESWETSPVSFPSEVK